MEFDHIQHPKKRAWLRAFAECGHHGNACAAAGIDRSTAWLWRRDDPEFAEAFSRAELMAADYLEEEARRRAVEGVRRLQFHKGEPITDPATGEPYIEHQYSDTLLIFLLKGAKPERYRERHEHSGPGGAPLPAIQVTCSPPPPESSE